MTESLEDTVLSDLLGGDSKDPDDESFDKTVSQNSLTLDQKLDMAIQFSEALAELQGYVGGATALWKDAMMDPIAHRKIYVAKTATRHPIRIPWGITFTCC